MGVDLLVSFFTLRQCKSKASCREMPKCLHTWLKAQASPQTVTTRLKKRSQKRANICEKSRNNGYFEHAKNCQKSYLIVQLRMVWYERYVRIGTIRCTKLTMEETQKKSQWCETEKVFCYIDGSFEGRGSERWWNSTRIWKRWRRRRFEYHIFVCTSAGHECHNKRWGLLNMCEQKRKLKNCTSCAELCAS